MKVKKDGVTRELHKAEEIEIFMQAGWIEVKEAPKKEVKKEEK